MNQEEHIKNTLLEDVDQISLHPETFAKHPDKDFTRKRKLSAEEYRQIFQRFNVHFSDSLYKGKNADIGIFPLVPKVPFKAAVMFPDCIFLKRMIESYYKQSLMIYRFPRTRGIDWKCTACDSSAFRCFIPEKQQQYAR